MEWINELGKQLRHRPLPGKEAQAKMSAMEGRFPSPPPTVRKAGVMALFFPSQRGWALCFIQRPTINPNDPHSGQISFPGGRMEKKDLNLWDTAKRETEEEIGVSAKHIKKVGQLTSLYVPVSNYLVYPHVGYIEREPDFQLQETEVSDIITPPVKHLLDNRKIKYKDMTVRRNFELKSVPHFYLDEYEIWGATAMMLNELREALLHLKVEID